LSISIPAPSVPGRLRLAGLLVGALFFFTASVLAVAGTPVEFAKGRVSFQGALAQYQQITVTGGWPIISPGGKLKIGDQGDRVAILRQRLSRSNDLLPASVGGDLFDSDLDGAVRRFQLRHGLHVDGVVGSGTMSALNVPTAVRTRQLELNRERGQLLLRDLEARAILVNIADYSLAVLEDGRAVLDMRVVVGRPDRQTPVFSGAVTTLVLNSYWLIPPMIAVKDVLPHVRKDPGYLGRLGIRVFQVGEAGAQEIDAQAIDWRYLSAAHFPYRLRQDPGPRNAMGQVKFIFANPYGVFLHDTPSRELFSLTKRTLSSGCIRVEKPLELAAYLLRGTTLGSLEAIKDALTVAHAKTVKLPEPVPIHLIYLTAWGDESGTVQFRSDIYGQDDF